MQDTSSLVYKPFIYEVIDGRLQLVQRQGYTDDYRRLLRRRGLDKDNLLRNDSEWPRGYVRIPGPVDIRFGTDSTV